MKSHSISSFFAQCRQRFFKTKVDQEICDRIGAQLNHEGDFGYPFTTRDEMKAQTDTLSVRQLFDENERLVANMPAFYGEAFRYIMHRELRRQLLQYRQLAERRVQPKDCDPRLVARYA